MIKERSPFPWCGVDKPKERKKVAFICVHNSCRSQIAEALGNYLIGDFFECYSAGTEVKLHITDKERNRSAPTARQFALNGVSRHMLPGISHIFTIQFKPISFMDHSIQTSISVGAVCEQFIP